MDEIMYFIHSLPPLTPHRVICQAVKKSPPLSFAPIGSAGLWEDNAGIGLCA